MQNLINELTDRVSALTAREKDLEATVVWLRDYATSVERKSDGILAENKRLKAEVRDLTTVLVGTMVSLKDVISGEADENEIRELVEEIKIDARNNIEEVS